MSFNVIFGVPVYKARMPNHEEILEGFMPFIESEDNFNQATFWDCDCRTTMLDEEKNGIFPWHLFSKTVNNLFNEYARSIGLSQEACKNIYGKGWVNRYAKGQNQEVHDHRSENIIISCAYMLKLPPNSASFSFYDSSYNLFPSHLASCFSTYPFMGKRFSPPLEEGDIIFFPASLDHYVSTHKNDELRSTISANFSINTTR